MTKLQKLRLEKEALRGIEKRLIHTTEGERDMHNSHDMHLIEKARMAVSESLVQLDLFFESRTASEWSHE